MPITTLLALPPGACDSAIHVFEPGWAPRPGFTGTLPDAPLPAYRALQVELGLARVMISQASGYGFDNSLLLASLDALGGSGRGTVVIPADIDEQSLTDMHRRGARGVRFMMFAGVLGWDDMLPVAERVASLGWHLKVQMDGRQIVDYAPLLASLPVEVLMDVYPTTFPATLDPDGPEIATLLELVERDNFWVSLTAPNTPEECAEPPFLARRLVAQAPNRCLWSSNWPHLNVSPTPSPQHGLHWLGTATTNSGQRNKILTDNPQRLFGF
ncbi:amidohydrolase family protein [Devosia sp. A369]